MPRWLIVPVYALILFPPAGMLLLIVWPLTRLSGVLFAQDLEVFALAIAAAGVSLLLATRATGQANNYQERWNHRA
ncbi:hypothetical protein [Methylobacterium nigriterrae]|uniref:hypothetical protein n=1 Tax=Methylobacterium nigriterrae TaxID=3127512 RepID=UPI00301327E7